MIIKGDRTIREYNVEIEISARDLYGTIREHICKKLELPYGAYLSDGKIKWDEDTSTSHYSYDTHDLEATPKQLEAMEILYKLSDLLKD